MQIYNAFIQMAATLGSVAMMNQIVALDRERQYFRFLFAHRVRPWHFYLQRFAVALLLLVALFATIPIGFSLFVTPVSAVPALQSMALYGFLVGSLAMLCGALVQRDGIALIVVFAAASVLQQAKRMGNLPSVLGVLADALPPFHRASVIRTEWLTGVAVDAGDLLIVIGYGLAMLVAALVVVKRFPLVR
jgi:hypothetical protein